MARKTKTVKKRKLFTTATKLDADLYARFVVLSDYRDMTLSQALRHAVREYVERFERGRSKPERAA